MDRYVYINLIAGDNDKDVPAIIRFKAVDFGRDVDSKIFDKPCKPIRPLEKFVEKFLGISNNELEKYPSRVISMSAMNWFYKKRKKERRHLQTCKELPKALLAKRVKSWTICCSIN